ncbi:hypothetical protein S1OALGB6SA_1049 [Olavius algarvensis spirochete endosymbiont]|uniref:glycosyltransferase family 2 protein n=1 Tax=Olavius algarvensis spirochete endosymbiont TaxID=260710 RepID=UPI000F2AA84F|nr:glycosyltransferase family 2 protein [Olavius algarvensis spirochete endosymbiont]VDA99975.1 hypothetical protein S1OALGB6SA_1049 [Olavius algarvensis spirochete endosymbiont]
MMMPEIFITTCNREDGLHKMLQSLISCKTEFSSVTIIDNGSCKIDRLQKYRNNFKIVYKKNESNIGFFGSLDVALRHVTKEFFVIYHDDDLAVPGALTKQVTFLKNNPHVPLVGTCISIFNERGEASVYPGGYHESIKIFKRREIMKAYLETSFVLPFPTIMYRKELIDRDEMSFLRIFSGKCTDAVMQLKLNSKYEIAIINQPLYRYYKPTLQTEFDDLAIGKFHVNQYELFVGMAIHIELNRDELRMLKKRARMVTRDNFVRLILLSDSNQQEIFSKTILERKEFRELCIYLKWLYIFRNDLERVIAVLRVLRNVKQKCRKLKSWFV